MLYSFKCGSLISNLTQIGQKKCGKRIYHHHHISAMELGHLLTRSILTYPEVSSKVCHDSFCQLDESVSLPWVIYYEAFQLHVVSIYIYIYIYIYMSLYIFMYIYKLINIYYIYVYVYIYIQIQHVTRIPRNRLPRVMKHYPPTGRRNHGRPLKRLLDT